MRPQRSRVRCGASTTAHLLRLLLLMMVTKIGIHCAELDQTNSDSDSGDERGRQARFRELSTKIMTNGVPLIVAAERGIDDDAARWRSKTVLLSAVTLTDAVYLSASTQSVRQGLLQSSIDDTIIPLQTGNEFSLTSHPFSAEATPTFTKTPVPTLQTSVSRVDSHLTKADLSHHTLTPLQNQIVTTTTVESSLTSAPLAVEDVSGGLHETTALQQSPSFASENETEESGQKIKNAAATQSNLSSDVFNVNDVKISNNISTPAGDLNRTSVKFLPNELSSAASISAETIGAGSPLLYADDAADVNDQVEESAAVSSSDSLFSVPSSHLTSQEYLSAISPYLYNWASATQNENVLSTTSSSHSDQEDTLNIDSEKPSAELLPLKDTISSSSTVVSGSAVPPAGVAVNSGIENSPDQPTSSSYATRLGSLAGGLLGLGGLGAAGLSGVDLGSVVSSAIRTVLPIAQRNDEKSQPLPYRIRRPYHSRPFPLPAHRYRKDDQNNRRDALIPETGYLAVRGPQGQVIGPISEANYFRGVSHRNALRNVPSHKLLLPQLPTKVSSEVERQTPIDSNRRVQPNQMAVRKVDSFAPSGFIAIVPPSKQKDQLNNFSPKFRQRNRVPSTNVLQPPPPPIHLFGPLITPVRKYRDPVKDSNTPNRVDKKNEVKQKFQPPIDIEKFQLNKKDITGRIPLDNERRVENSVNEDAIFSQIKSNSVLENDSTNNADDYLDKFVENDQIYSASVTDVRQKFGPDSNDQLLRPFNQDADNFVRNSDDTAMNSPIMVSTLHTIASVEGLNRIVGTNVFASVVPLLTTPAIISFKSNLAPILTTRPAPSRTNTRPSFSATITATVKTLVPHHSASSSRAPTLKISTTSSSEISSSKVSKNMIQLSAQSIQTEITKLSPNVRTTESVQTESPGTRSPVRSYQTEQSIKGDSLVESLQVSDSTVYPLIYGTHNPNELRTSLSLESSIDEVTSGAPWLFQDNPTTTNGGRDEKERYNTVKIKNKSIATTTYSFSATPALELNLRKTLDKADYETRIPTTRRYFKRNRTRLADRIRLTMRPTRRNQVQSNENENLKNTKPNKQPHETNVPEQAKSEIYVGNKVTPKYKTAWRTRATSYSVNLFDASKVTVSSEKSAVTNSFSVKDLGRTRPKNRFIKSNSYLLSVTKGSYTTIVGPDAKTLPSNIRTTKSVDSSTLIHGTSTIFDGALTRPTLPLLNIHDTIEINNGVGSPQTNYITRTEYFTRTITATKTEVRKSGTSIRTTTVLITSTLKPITIISTIIGVSTNIVTLNTATPTRLIQLIHSTREHHQTPNKNFSNIFTENEQQLNNIDLFTSPSPKRTIAIEPQNTTPFDLETEANIFNEDKVEIDQSKADAEISTSDPSVAGLADNGAIPSSELVPSASTDDTISLGERIYQGVHEDNEVNRVVVNPGVNRQVVVDRPVVVTQSCVERCRSAAREVCRKTKGVYMCACQPGYARSSSNDTCQAVSTYQLAILLEKVRDLPLTYRRHFDDNTSAEHRTLTLLTRTGVERALAGSPLSDRVKHVDMVRYRPVSSRGQQFRHLTTGLQAELIVQLDETNEKGDEKATLRESILRSISRRNFSLGDKDLIVSRHTEAIAADDFDECASEEYNDCHDYAYCYNMDGGFTCSCRDGMVDAGPADAPGRVCSSATMGCESCHYHGQCVAPTEPAVGSSGSADPADRAPFRCQCHRWYAGARCQINLRVLLIAGAVAAAVLLLAAAVCCCCCCRCCHRHRKSGDRAQAARGVTAPLVFTGSDGILRARGRTAAQPGLERRAMLDSSSSDSTVVTHPSLIPSSLVALKGVGSRSSMPPADCGAGSTLRDSSGWSRRGAALRSDAAPEAASSYQGERSVGSVGEISVPNMGGARSMMGGARCLMGGAVNNALVARLIPRAKASKFPRYPSSRALSGSVCSNTRTDFSQERSMASLSTSYRGPAGVGTLTGRWRSSRNASGDSGSGVRNASGASNSVCLHPNGRSHSSDSFIGRHRLHHQQQQQLRRQRHWSSSQSSVQFDHQRPRQQQQQQQQQQRHGGRVLGAESTVGGRALCEARSLDETTLQRVSGAASCSGASHLSGPGCRTPGSSAHTGFTDDHHTMAEKDAASTFVMPPTQLFLPAVDYDNRSELSLMDDFPHLRHSHPYSRASSVGSTFRRH